MNEEMALGDPESLSHLIFQEQLIFRDKSPDFQKLIFSACSFGVSPIIHGYQITKTYKIYLYAQICTEAIGGFLPRLCSYFIPEPIKIYWDS